MKPVKNFAQLTNVSREGHFSLEREYGSWLFFAIKRQSKIFEGSPRIWRQKVYFIFKKRKSWEKKK
jgi:hypothetical protein